jgi:hypothetical protein
MATKKASKEEIAEREHNNRAEALRLAVSCRKLDDPDDRTVKTARAYFKFLQGEGDSHEIKGTAASN